MSQAVQIGVAIAIGVAILLTGRWGVRFLATPIPEDADPDDVIEVEATFSCTICGLRLTVTHAQGDDVKAPRHCREEMAPG